MKMNLLLLLGAAQVLTTPVWAGEAIETLAIFDGSNGSNPGNIVQGQHGDFFGTTYTGGTNDKGTIFEVPLNKQVHTIVNFNGTNGASPDSHIVQAPNGTFYGTTREGGAYNKGTVFAFTPGSFHTIVSFNGANGDTPAAGLLRGSDGQFYGTTTAGGATGHGTIFVLSSAGQLRTIASFTGANGSSPGPLLRGQDGNLYGVTGEGGAVNDGTVFRLGGSGGPANSVVDPKEMISYGAIPNSDPSGYTAPSPNYSPGGGFTGEGNTEITTIHTFNGADGANPHSRLTQLEDGTIFGTTTNGGSNNLGTVFSIKPAGDFKTVLAFNGTNGSHPSSALIPWSNGYFYMERLWDNLWIKASTVQWSGVSLSGTTSGGGSQGHGTAFQVTPDGTLTTLLTFDGTQGRVMGTIPNSLTPGDDGDLYGTTYYGGPSNNGTVFRILLQHQVPAAGAGFGQTAQPANSL